MLIYLIHSNYVNSFELSEYDGKYILSDYDSNNNERSLVNIECKNGKSFITSNNKVRILSNNIEVKKAELIVGNFYILKLIGGEQIVLCASLLNDNTFTSKVVANNSILKIGNDKNNDISYYGVDGLIELSYNKKFTIKNVNCKSCIFVNNKRILNCELNNFDRIFINGLKIVVCNNILFINNINNLVSINSKYLSIVNTDEVAASNVNNNYNNFIDFYDAKDYFFKKPVFQHKPDTLKIDISEPPVKEEKDDDSVFMTTVPTFIMSMASIVTVISSVRNYRNGSTDFDEMFTELLMAFSILVGGILWPFVEQWVRNLKISFKNKSRSKKYHLYLQKKQEIFEKAVNEQKISLSMNNPEVSNCVSIIEQRKNELYSRNIENENFLNIRLGTGKVKLSCELEYKKQDFVLEKDSLINDLENLIDKYEYFDDSPYLLSLKETKVCAFVIDSLLFNQYMNNILLQILTYHSYLDLKIVIFTSKNSDLYYLKNINHCWSDDKDVRFFATSINEAQSLSTILERELNQRKTKDSNDNSPYYLVVSDCIDMYRNVNIIDDIINSDNKYNFGLLMFDTKISDIPNKCVNFVNISSSEGAFFQTDMSSSNIKKFKPEFINNYDINLSYCINLLNDIPLRNNANANLTLPDNYDFLEMFNVGNIEQLNVGLRWDNSNLFNSLSTPIGIDQNGNVLYLDLHEKAHGPHGLIAGMTGSGKSELIITYILSLAVNYRPDEVQFVLIDYKGGGLAGAFENRRTGMKLPHLVGTITNLDTSEMKRTLVSIKSELQRRQRLFNEAKENLESGNIDIYKYQKLYREGKINQTLSHLFIICDEFAELKAQQPDFMDELVSAARIGRSLGVHLILATQKPSGIVDEQIWSNSKFKISCKVQTTEDSNEVIKKPDAAFLKETGRFYLQVGYDEYFIEGQAAYTGNNYVPSETFNSKVDNSISFINDIGEVIKSVSKKEKKKEVRDFVGDELTNILSYIIDVAEKKGYTKHQLWLDNIPNVIYLNNLVKKYSYKAKPYLINPVIGEYDDPKNQKQGPVLLDISSGNVCILGSTGSGRTTLLSTFIYSNIINHNCDEVNFYIVDCGSEKLKIFQNAPQVGEVLTVTDKDKINNLFYMIDSEILRRQKYYSKNGGSFLSDVSNGKSFFSNIIIVINDIDVFKEVYEDLYDSLFSTITRNCIKYGIYFIVSCSSTGSLGFMVENNFSQKIVLNLNDQSDYSLIFNNSPIPNKNPGRGIIQLDEPYEFQTALVFKESEYAKNLIYVFEQLNKFLKNHVKPVPIVPKNVTFDIIKESITDLSSVPLGINEKSAQLGYYDFYNNFVTVVTSLNLTVMLKFLGNFINIINLCTNNKVVILNAISKDKITSNESIKEYTSGFTKIVSTINENLYKNSNDNSTVTLIVLGYGKIQNYLDKEKASNPGVITLDDLVGNSSNTRFRYIIYEPSSSFEKFKLFKIYDYIDDAYGIWVGSGFDEQMVFSTENVYSTEHTSRNDEIVTVINGECFFIKYVK
ncbi:MAG: type VII secretion protein EssC [Bacilli bacterium]|nr:type VII secretion protein EssC [Bacilli bacterium]